VIGAVLALLAAGCSGSGSEDGAAGNESSATTGGILKVGDDLVGGTGVQLDPGAYVGNSFNQSFLDLVYGTMLRATKDGPVPNLAAKVTAPDDSTVQVTLRPGLTFSNGEALDANAVKASWDRSVPLSVIGPSMALESVEVTSATGLTVHLSAPAAQRWMDMYLAESTTGLGVIAPSVLKGLQPGEKFTDWNKAIGAGPFKITNYVTNQRLELRRNDGFWDESQQKLEGLDFIQTAVGTPRVTALASGTIDMGQVSQGDVAGLKAQGIEVLTDEASNFMSTAVLHFCATKPPFNNVGARKAIAAALDPAAIEAAIPGIGKANRLIQSPKHPYYPSSTPSYVPSFNVDQAKAELAAAGVAPGTKITLLSRPEAAYVKVGEVIQQQLAAVGLTAELQPSPNTFADAPKLQPEAVIKIGTPLAGVGVTLMDDGPGAFCTASNTATTAAYKKLYSVSYDERQQAAAWDALNRAIYTEYGVVPFLSTNLWMAHSKKVKGLDYLTMFNWDNQPVHLD
jgi:peptide/nickel transport system substrate-binding protein